MQTNHFSQSDVSFKASVAKIPWLKSSFIGFIAGLWVNNQLIQFTTYNKTDLKKVLIDKNIVELELSNNNYRLEITATPAALQLH